MTFIKNTLAAVSAFALVAVPMGALAAPAKSVAPVGASVQAKSKLAPELIAAAIALLLAAGIIILDKNGKPRSP